MSTSHGSIARVQAMLDNLPEFEPDAALWTRIEAARARRRGARLAVRSAWWGAGIAAALAVVVLRTGAPDPGLSADESGTLAWQRQSEALEREWLAGERAPGHAPARARLLGIDGALQAAYDRGATADELEPLWRQRHAALRSLIDHDAARTAAVTRI
ncbi:hypothetical protein ACQQ2N_06695 [Dokdonella sp. MW10]|uniref:hypothetical protein n=1 Tax=Dokdonella sp. MW10 TaxID=2992926 RepID=UPI003F7F3A02